MNTRKTKPVHLSEAVRRFQRLLNDAIGWTSRIGLFNVERPCSDSFLTSIALELRKARHLHAPLP